MARIIAHSVVVVLGASSGIGRATVLAFGRAGARVVAASRDLPALESLVEEVRGAGGEALAVRCDITDADDVRRLADAAERTFGRVDTWVNSAGVFVSGRVADLRPIDAAEAMTTNYIGHLHGVQAALPALHRAGGGAIIGVCSAESVRAVPLQAAYAASKAAARHLYDCLRLELIDDGAPITVTTILPAGVDTPIFEHGRDLVGPMAQPPPPVYAPELVADAIVAAAARPTREVPVGAAALLFIWGERMSPALTDAVMTAFRFIFRVQLSSLPDNGTDNLAAPSAPHGQVRGGVWSGPVFISSRITRVLARTRTPAELLTGLLAKRRASAT